MATDRAKILYLDHTSMLGGAERSLLDLLGRLDRDRIEPLLVTSPHGPVVERAHALDIEVALLELDPESLTMSREQWQTKPLAFAWQARGYGAEVLRLARLVRNREIDALHTNTLKAHVLGSLVARLTGRPIVWHMRDLPTTRGNTRNLLDVLDRLVSPGVIAISQAVAADLSPAMASRLHVVYNGINLATFDASAATDLSPLAVPTGIGPLIGTVSHLIPWKGQDVFLRAAARVLVDHPDARFVIVGDVIFQFRQERERLTALAAELGLADRVLFAGNREDVPAILAGLDLFVLPSLYEPFGRVLIEAMAASLPIVASRAGGVPEIVEDGITGTLVEPGNAEALASAIASLLADRPRAQRFGEAGRARVEKCFSLEATVRGVENAYESFGILRQSVSPCHHQP